ncbi:AlpA family phage regulatory protein [Synechococcus sp. MU1655]
MYRSIAAWEFPKQVPIGGNTVVWTESSFHE